MERRRSDLAIGLVAAVVLHGLALAAAAKVLMPREEAPPFSADPPLKVVMLEEQVFLAQLEETIPAPSEPLEASAHHAPTPPPEWPELEVAAQPDTPYVLEVPPRREPIEPDPTRPPRRRERLEPQPLLEREEPPPDAVETTEAVQAVDPTPVAITDTSSLVLYRPPLEYPRRPHRRGIEGVVRVGIEIGAGGTVARTWVITSSGNRELDRAAVRNLKAWRFGVAAIEAAGLRGRPFRNDVRFVIE